MTSTVLNLPSSLLLFLSGCWQENKHRLEFILYFHQIFNMKLRSKSCWRQGWFWQTTNIRMQYISNADTIFEIEPSACVLTSRFSDFIWWWQINSQKQETCGFLYMVRGVKYLTLLTATLEYVFKLEKRLIGNFVETERYIFCSTCQKQKQ